MAEPISVFASFRPRAEAREVFLDLMSGMVEHTRDEPGCEVYDLYADADGGYHLFERYVDAAGLDAHRETAHYKDYRARVADMLEGGIGVVVLTEIDRAG